LQKVNTKKLKVATTLYNTKIVEEKRVVQEKLKVKRDCKKAKKAAIAVAKKAELNTRKKL
jgi:hypothetical protein